MKSFISLSILLVQCHGFPRSHDSSDQRSIEDDIRSGDFTIVDTRTDFERELVGFVPGSLRPVILADYVDNEDVIFIVADLIQTGPANLCQEKHKARCVVANDIGQDLLVYSKDISFQALSMSLQSNKVLLVDVRNATELENPGQIPGSVNLPLYEIPEAFLLDDSEFLEKYGFNKPETEAKNVVLTCRSGRRIQVADARLQKLGYENLRLYYGSFKDWVKNGGEIIKQD